MLRLAPCVLAVFVTLHCVSAGGTGPSPPVRQIPDGDLNADVETGTASHTCQITESYKYCMYKIPSSYHNGNGFTVTVTGTTSKMMAKAGRHVRNDVDWSLTK